MTSDDHPAKFRVLATCAVFEPGFRGGGPVRSLARIVDSVSAHVDMTLITSDRDLGAASRYPELSGKWVERRNSRVFYLATDKLLQWVRLVREIRGTTFDLMYVNSLWEPRFSVLPIVAARLGLIRVSRILVAPRGELSPGALMLKAWKKQLFLLWWSSFLRRAGVWWHASAEKEASEIRVTFPWAVVEVNQDQVSLPAEPMPATEPESEVIRFVFIGRISKMKNLLLALRALQRLDTPAHMAIYGPIEDTGYWNDCRTIMAALPPGVTAEYRGELSPDRVRPEFSGNDAFVFPTLGENFGHVIAESLSASCPVICTDRTPWTAILDGGGGLVVESLTAEAVAEAMRRIAQSGRGDRMKMRRSAGAAYQQWRRRLVDGNVIDQVRLRSTLSQTECQRIGTP